MSRHRVIPSAALTALAMALALALAACSSGEGDSAGSGGGTVTTAGGSSSGGSYDDGYGSPSDTTAGDAAGGSGEAKLTASGFAWSEDTLRLSKDTTKLEVTNSDSALHSFTAAAINVDEDIKGGSTVDVTIDLSGASGTVDFVCKYHPDMKGKIEVT